MDRAITFTLDGPPQGKGRARSTKTGIHYTPEKTASYETRMAWTFKQTAGIGWKMFEGAVSVHITAKFAVPKSWSKKKKEGALSGMIRPTVKPDWDNIGKLLDGINGIAWKDDSQITTGTVAKRYAESSGLIITIREEDL